MSRKIMFLTLLALLVISGYSQNNVGASLLKTDFVKPEGITFKVHDVEMADSALMVENSTLVFENRIEKKILFLPEEHAGMGVVSCANNGLIQTVQECYDNHRPLILTPDVIWLAICQGVSIHINEHYDSLKNKLFTANKPDEIMIRNDSLGEAAKYWAQLIDAFSSETQLYTKNDFYSFFVSDFSTTTDIERTAYRITLLESYAKAFEYVGESGCGIPYITVAGNKRDWKIILEKIEMLEKIGLTEWARELRPVISEFVKAADGKPDIEFWKNIYKNATEYNGFYISGWIIKFFPYIKELQSEGDNNFDETQGGYKREEVYLPNKFMEGDSYLLSTLSTDNFPSGIAKVSIVWINRFKNNTVMMELYAGFFAIRQYEDRSLEPLISWTVCEKNAKLPAQLVSYNQYLNLKHNPDYWSPYIVRRITDSAVYDIKRYKTQENSVAYIKQRIIESLKNSREFCEVELMNDTVEVVVLSNGKVGGVTLKGADNVKLSSFIAELIKGLEKPWFPALAHPTDALDLMDYTLEEETIKVRVNSIVKIVF